MAATTNIQPVPYRTPVLASNGLITPEWLQWLDLLRRAILADEATLATLTATGTTTVTTTSGQTITLETNGAPNSTQTLLNLVAGSNVTLTENGGDVIIAASGGGSGITITLETNGTANSTQTLLNLVAGTNVTLSESGGSVTINASGSGSVTSVGLSMPAEFSVSGSPVTGSGTITVTKANESANRVFAGPTTGSAAAPTFRALVAADIPNIAESQVTNLTTDLAGKVPTTRLINTTAPLTGGGDLSADRTLAVSTATTGAVGVVKPDGTSITIDGTGKISATAVGTNVQTPSGTMNGSNVTFTLANVPITGLFLNGVWQRPAGVDYSLSGSTITYTVAPKSTDTHTAAY